MKKVLFTFICVLFITNIFAQTNMTLRSQFSYGDVRLNDVWGWADEETGKEYALVGARTGVSIVDVTDPDNVEEKVFFDGPTSVWRDLKTYGDFAYVTNEEANGLEVIDLSNLPTTGEATSFNWTPVFPNGDTLESCHNLYIDEFGYCYLVGCNTNSGGAIIIDVFSNPGQPEFVAFGPSIYSHDAYVRENKFYSSQIGEGNFVIYDVTDKQNIIDLGSSPTLFGTTHNAWLSDDGNYLFTTDEKADATTGSYDVSDPTDIEALDQFRPLATVGIGVIPHNTHVLEDWLITSHYTDGGIIVDASEPDNLIEVGNYDTFTGDGQGFQGCWGAYPFLPSGTVLLTDITNGLFVLTPNYVSACRLEGVVTDENTGAAIAFATAIIDTEQENEGVSDFTGNYKTGIVTAGTYDVTYDAPGYDSEVISVTLENGVTVMQDVELGESARYDLTGTVISSEDGTAIPFAQVFLNDGFFEYYATADANGVFVFEQIFMEQYTALAGAWGFEYKTQDITLNADTDIEIVMDEGYEDDFIFDLNWEVSGDATAGQWEWVEPVGTSYELRFANPRRDISSDNGKNCYVTGNNGDPDYVKNGTVTLTSPVMDLTGYEVPFIRYSKWFFNRGPNDAFGDDALEVRISNGVEEVVLQTLEISGSFWQGVSGYLVEDYIEVTDNMRLIVETADTGDDHVIEAGFDFFQVTDGNTISTEDISDFAFDINFAPNPFQESTALTYQIASPFKQGEFTVYNQIGQLIQQEKIETASGSLNFGNTWQNGLYLLKFSADGKVVHTEKLIKF